VLTNVSSYMYSIDSEPAAGTLPTSQVISPGATSPMVNSHVTYPPAAVQHAVIPVTYDLRHCYMPPTYKPGNSCYILKPAC